MEHLRIASYNIHSGVGQDGRYDIARVAQTIRDLHAHIVGLQEVERNLSFQKTRIWSKPHADDQTEVIARLADYPYYAFVSLRGY